MMMRWGLNSSLSKLMIAMTIIMPTRHCRGSQSICGVWGRRMVGWLVLSSSPDRLQNPHKGLENMMYTLFVNALLCVIVEAEDADVKSSRQGLECFSVRKGLQKSYCKGVYVTVPFFPSSPLHLYLSDRNAGQRPSRGEERCQLTWKSFHAKSCFF